MRHAYGKAALCPRRVKPRSASTTRHSTDKRHKAKSTSVTAPGMTGTLAVVVSGLPPAPAKASTSPTVATQTTTAATPATTTPKTTATPKTATTPKTTATPKTTTTSSTTTTPKPTTTTTTTPSAVTTTTTTSTPTPTPPTTGSSANSTGDPLGGDQFYVNPNDSAVREENTLISQGQSAQAAQLEPIAREPEAIWLTYDGSQSVVPGVMSAAASSGTVPVFVVYNIPWRDCGSYSSGGASSAGDYQSFIDSIVSEIGQGKAVLIVEPDALTEMSCLSSAQQQTYYQLLSYAVQRLDSDANASVYVDAGHPGWQSASTEAGELSQVLGSTRAGFAVNVSNFVSTASDISYGTQISQQTGGRHFVIDTSRNGANVPSGQWCNPSSAGLGADPTTDTGSPLVDADLWIKGLGESDGQCNGGPSAGQFWLSYALQLVANG